MRVFVTHEAAFVAVVFFSEAEVFFLELLDSLAGLGRLAAHRCSSAALLFVEDYDVDFASDVFFGAADFGAVAYGCDFAFEEACYAVYG